MFFIMLLKQTTVKILIYGVILVFYVKIRESHNKNDNPFSSCSSETSDGNTLKQSSQCVNTVLLNMNDH